jgi:hypothetical protein
VAVPQIVRILPYGAELTDPIIGPTSGSSFVEIYGGNFRLPGFTISMDPRAPMLKSVRVLFGRLECPRVAVVRSNLIRVITPPSPLPFDRTLLQDTDGKKFYKGNQGTVSVTVENIDDDGNLIAGETVTLPNAFTYLMPQLNSLTDTTLYKVNNTLIQLWQRDVCLNVVNHQSVEYDSDTGDLRSVVDKAKLPAIVLLGPQTRQNRLFTIQSDRIIDPALVPGLPQEERFLIARAPYTLDLEYEVVGMAASRTVLLNLMEASFDFINKTPFIEINRGATEEELGKTKLDLGFPTPDSAFDVDLLPNNSDLNTFRGKILLSGIDIERIDMPGDGGRGAVPIVTDINIEYCKY